MPPRKPTRIDTKHALIALAGVLTGMLIHMGYTAWVYRPLAPPAAPEIRLPPHPLDAPPPKLESPDPAPERPTHAPDAGTIHPSRVDEHAVSASSNRERDTRVMISALETAPVNEEWRDSYSHFLDLAAESMRSSEGKERAHLKILTEKAMRHAHERGGSLLDDSHSIRTQESELIKQMNEDPSK